MHHRIAALLAALLAFAPARAWGQEAIPPPPAVVPATDVNAESRGVRLVQATEAAPTGASPAPAPEARGGSGAGTGETAPVSNGANPADTTQKFSLRNEYVKTADGSAINTATVGFSFPIFGKRGSLGLNLPFNYLDLASPLVGNLGGIGDAKASVTYNVWARADKKFTFVVGSDAWIPSADSVFAARDPTLGRITFQDIGAGKFRFGPLAALVYAPAPGLIFAPLYQHEFSVAGDAARPDIHRGVAKFFGMKAWKSGVYLLAETQLLIDYERGGDVDALLAPEIGYSSKGTTVFGKVGFGINPDPANRELTVSFGIRQNY